MQESVPLEESFRGAALEPAERCLANRTRVYDLLRDRNLAPSPSLVSDVLTAILDGTHVRSNERRDYCSANAAHCMAELVENATANFGALGDHETLRLEAALRFLTTWFAGAPSPGPSVDQLPSMDLAALGLRRQLVSDASGWVAWRSNEESRFSDGGSPSFRHALAELRLSSVRSVGKVDERVWYLPGTGSREWRSMTIPAKQHGGSEHISVRSLIGPFNEVSSFGLPPDPSRVTPADLALFAADTQPMRALLASKLADSGLMVRFGSMDMPARQRPRVLIVAGLFDGIKMHVQRRGEVVPSVEPLRECLLRSLSACLCTFASAAVDFELEVRRDGPSSRGVLALRDLRNRAGRLRLEYRSPEALRDELMKRAPWLYADTRLAQFRRAAPTPHTSNYDASYLLAVGSAGTIQGTCNWTGTVTAEPTDDGACTVFSSGSIARPSVSFTDLNPESISHALSDCFGDEPGRLERGEGLSDALEDAVIA
jgi:hypothetical protein